MRTTKRFTPHVLDRYEKLGRGKGTEQDYVPWHRVSRSDPASQGRSHLQSWTNRQRELLSDQEWAALFFAIMLINLLDLREQFPLSLERAPHELSDYLAGSSATAFPGTLEISKRLGIKHPRVNGDGKSENWVMSTDLLLTLTAPDGKLELLAVSIKLAKELQKKRTTELLEIERLYWQERGVKWLLITPDMFDERVALTLRCSMPWALGNAVSEADLQTSVDTLNRHSGCSIIYLLTQLSSHFGDMNHAQRAFWQAVWTGRITMDLRRDWRPHHPIVLLAEEDFWALNPIASRRSAWI